MLTPTIIKALATQLEPRLKPILTELFEHYRAQVYADLRAEIEELRREIETMKEG